MRNRTFSTKLWMTVLTPQVDRYFTNKEWFSWSGCKRKYDFTNYKNLLRRKKSRTHIYIYILQILLNAPHTGYLINYTISNSSENVTINVSSFFSISDWLLISSSGSVTCQNCQSCQLAYYKMRLRRLTHIWLH